MIKKLVQKDQNQKNGEIGEIFANSFRRNYSF